MTKVLLVDDDEDIHELLREQLRVEHVKNVELISAMSGSEGAQKYIDEGANMVIMDLRMPNGDGVFATKKIIRHDPAAKIFIMTAYPSSTETTQSLDAGAMGIVKKAGQYAALIIAFILAVTNGGVID